MSNFRDLLQLESLFTFLEEEGLVRPHAVQQAAIPRLLRGASVSVLAPTGSGKTLAYALPVAQHLKNTEGEAPVPLAPRAWILVPTAELMEQVAAVFRGIAHRVKLRVRVDRPGKRGKQTQALLAGPIDILVTSPARAKKALTSRALSGHQATFLICDEADQLFDRGFVEDVSEVYARLRSPHLQVGLFSATNPGWFESKRDELFSGVSFEDVVLQSAHRLKDNITTFNRTVPFREKLEHALAILKKLTTPGLVFTNFKENANTLFEALQGELGGKHLELLHGDVPKAERREAVARFARGGDILVCTDVAARGLDLPEVDWVLNYDMPFDPVYYMHRCGRAGRTGRPARVFNLVTTKDFPLLNRINTAIAQQSSLKLSRIVPERPKKGEGKGKETKRGKASGVPSSSPAKGRGTSTKKTRPGDAPKGGFGSKRSPGAKVGPRTKTSPGTKTDLRSKPSTGAKTGPRAKPSSSAKTDFRSKPGTGAKVGRGSKPSPWTKSGPGTKAAPKGKPTSKTKTRAKLKPRSGSKTRPRVK